MHYIWVLRMKIYYLQNENKEIIQDDFERFDDKCFEMDKENYHIVNGYNGALFFQEYTETEEYKRKAEAFQKQAETADLRFRRITECFSVVNRGAPWYARLTEEQKNELNDWYQGWLDVTETKVVPNKPEWID